MSTISERLIEWARIVDAIPDTVHVDGMEVNVEVNGVADAWKAADEMRALAGCSGNPLTCSVVNYDPWTDEPPVCPKLAAECVYAGKTAKAA